MRVISCYTRFHAPSSICLSVFRRQHPQTRSFCCLRHENCSLSTNQMEQPDLVANTVIDNPRALTDKINLIRDAGPSKFQVIADFDATLTKYRVNGLRGQTSHGLLQQGNADYDAKRQALYDHYHPMEISPVIPIEEKTKLMEEWWSKTHDLLIEGGLTYDAIKKSVANSSIAFREGVTELFGFLEKLEIPVLIFSAGLADVIEEVLRQNLHRTFKNVKIVSNRMVFDDDGRLVSFKGKLIHVLNKNEHALDMAAPLHDQLGADIGEEEEGNAYVKQRTNVLLLGDHLGDLRMSDGLSYETRICIGFLNDNIEKSLESYRKEFDLVYINDAPMRGALELVSQLFSTEAS
ncbi:7-methylguanosine phosphate-specific 5'-nucleotidase A [Eutrema salsugineum]|nr:7-methylguanosine phosphate-specific 5'-nucleotidase A [Eutrema salsugineum]